MTQINEEDKENELVQISRGELNRLTKRDAEVERLRKENEIQKNNIYEHYKGVIAKHLDEIAALKKQVEEMRTEREFELAYCFGLMASDGVTIDTMAEATTSERWAKIKDEIKKLK